MIINDTPIEPVEQAIAGNYLGPKAASKRTPPWHVGMSKVLATKVLRGCPVRQHSVDQEDIEKDFTTNGKVGSLECPFAKLAPGGLPDTPNSQDPIAAEFHADAASTASPNPALGKCPIRFLDKHTPEEVAKYFENHKHEIPRSHAVCIQRYQRNENSIRQLDAKYGNLINMIQGLGVKHKQYFPEDEKPTKEEASSNEAVEKWADEVSEQLSKSAEDDPPRVSHFEKPLREVRVGESPSRPWGISVPVDQRIPASAMQSINGAHHESSGTTQAPATNAVPLTSSPNKTTPTPKGLATKLRPLPVQHDKSPQPARIVFNGPVFIGYSPDDAAKFLQNLGLGSKAEKHG